MAVRSTIKINKSKIKELSSGAITALEKTAEALHTEVVQAQVVPRKDGPLQNEKFFVDNSQSKNGKVSLCFEGPYARRLYYHPEYNFRKTENPNAKGKWLEDWMKGGSKQDFCNKTFKTFYKMEEGL